ncbi:MAG: ferredoxin [Gordonia sp. (in: high G+C Gram-positive bacteria)]
MKVAINLDKCAGHARCYAVDSELFDIDDDGYALRARFDVPDDPGAVTAAREAAAACPERAIDIAESPAAESSAAGS